MKFKPSLAQINSVLGDVNANLQKHLSLIKLVVNEKAGSLVFPELSLTGYLVQTLVTQVVIKPNQDDPIFSQMMDACQKLDLVVGFVQEDERTALDQRELSGILLQERRPSGR